MKLWNRSLGGNAFQDLSGKWFVLYFLDFLGATNDTLGTALKNIAPDTTFVCKIFHVSTLRGKKDLNLHSTRLKEKMTAYQNLNLSFIAGKKDFHIVSETAL